MEEKKRKQAKSLMKELVILDKQSLKKLQFAADILAAREQMLEFSDEIATKKMNESDRTKQI